MHLRIAAGWLTAVVLAGGTGRAQCAVNLRLNLGREAGASIRFGSEHHPPPIVRAVPPASVRYEHYREHERGRDHLGRPVWVAPPHVGHYRNPYNDVYFRRFRPGYRPVVVNGASTTSTPPCRRVIKRSSSTRCRTTSPQASTTSPTPTRGRRCSWPSRPPCRERRPSAHQLPQRLDRLGHCRSWGPRWPRTPGRRSRGSRRPRRMPTSRFRSASSFFLPARWISVLICTVTA